MDAGEFIVAKEGRFDAQGRLQVYMLPSGDGGGTFEIAGINDRYHPAMARKLADLIEDGKHAQALIEARRYIDDYTKAVAAWHPDHRVALFLRDTTFNRGAGGAAKILQMALKTAGTYAGALDGAVGPATKAAAAKHSAEDLVLRLLLSRSDYERQVVGRNEDSKFWAGLTNRWIDAAQMALNLGNPLKALS